MTTGLSQYREFALIDRLTRPFARHPAQVNATHGSDAELVALPDGSVLAATIDTLEEEFRLGLIADPFTVGWATIAHSLSDLAAVAAVPLGLLLAVNLPDELAGEWADRCFAGAAAAASEHNTYVLGGDTNFTTHASFTATALGRIERPPALQRVGAVPGDALYVTGPLGSGNLLPIARQIDAQLWAGFERDYRPRARCREALRLRGCMRCAIDTSDGLLQALAILAGVNGVGFRFCHDPAAYDPRLVELAAKIRFPLWLANVFGLGEHELVFTVAPADEPPMLALAGREGIALRRIGEVTAEEGVRMVMDGREHSLEVAHLLNLFAESPSIEAYIAALHAYDARLRSG